MHIYKIKKYLGYKSLGNQHNLLCLQIHFIF